MRRLLICMILGLCFGIFTFAQDTIDKISYGESYIGEFTQDLTSLTLGFDANAGDTIYINVLDNQVPVIFTIYAPDGEVVTESFNAQVLDLELTVDGEYTVEFIRPDWSEDVGRFTAHLNYYQMGSIVEPDEEPLLTSFGQLDDAGALHQVQVDFNEGDLVTMMSFGANLAIIIDPEEGETLLFQGVFDDPAVRLFRFPATGRYTITLITTEPGGTDVELYIHRREPVNVIINEPMTGQIEEGLPIVFAFETPADKMWDINAILPFDGDRLMTMYQFDGRDYWATQIYNDTGSGPNGQPRIRPFIPTTEGTYYIALWYNDWGTENGTFDYELTVNPSTLVSLPNDTPIVGEVTIDTGQMQYAYRGEAGDRVRVTLRRLSETGRLAMSIYSVEDEVITFSGRSADASSFDIELPFDGFYEFVIFNYDYDIESVLKYEILVEPLSE